MWRARSKDGRTDDPAQDAREKKQQHFTFEHVQQSASNLKEWVTLLWPRTALPSGLENGMDEITK
jgi:hypothetical protein